MKKKLLFAALAALTLVGCNDRNQSELKESDLGANGKTLVKATFYYNPGTRIVDGVEVTELLPIPETVEVFAVVDYSEWTNGTAGDAFKQVKATAKGEGAYEVEIPTGLKNVTFDLVANGFYADYWLAPDKDPIQAFFPKLTIAKIGVKAGQTEVKIDPAETQFKAPTEPLNNARNSKFTVSGKLEGNKEIWDNESFSPKSDKQAIAGIELELEIKAADPADSRELTFKATTAADGSYSFKDVLLYDEWIDALKADAGALETKISAKPWVDRNFKHFYKSAEGSASKIVFNQAGIGDEGSWDDAALNALYYLNDESKPVFLYQWMPGKSVDVVGAWEVTPIAVANLQANVTLYGEALNQNLTAKFAPKDINEVLGAGSNGKTNTVKNKSDESVKIPETTINNIMGW